jgi:hypothetical protein
VVVHSKTIDDGGMANLQCSLAGFPPGVYSEQRTPPVSETTPGKIHGTRTLLSATRHGIDDGGGCAGFPNTEQLKEALERKKGFDSTNLDY